MVNSIIEIVLFTLVQFVTSYDQFISLLIHLFILFKVTKKVYSWKHKIKEHFSIFFGRYIQNNKDWKLYIHTYIYIYEIWSMKNGTVNWNNLFLSCIVLVEWVHEGREVYFRILLHHREPTLQFQSVSLLSVFFIFTSQNFSQNFLSSLHHFAIFFFISF